MSIKTLEEFPREERGHDHPRNLTCVILAEEQGDNIIIITIIVIISSIKNTEPVDPFFGSSCFYSYAFDCKNSYSLLTSLGYSST